MYVCYYVNNSHFLSLHNVTRSRNVSKFPWLPWAMYTLITFSISVSASDSFVGGAAPSANVAPAMNFPTRAMSDGRERSCKVCTGWAVAARKLHVHNDLILRRNKYCTYVRLRDLFCIISVCSLRLFSSFLSGVPKERFSDVGVSFQHTNQRYVNRLSSTVSLLYRTRSASSSFSQCATRRPMCLGVKVSCMGDR